MGIKTLSVFEPKSDIIVSRNGWKRYDILFSTFSVDNVDGNMIVRPNAWPKEKRPIFLNLSWLQARYTIQEAMEHGLTVPKHIIDHFEHHTVFGRVICFIRSLFY